MCLEAFGALSAVVHALVLFLTFLISFNDALLYDVTGIHRCVCESMRFEWQMRGNESKRVCVRPDDQNQTCLRLPDSHLLCNELNTENQHVLSCCRPVSHGFNVLPFSSSEKKADCTIAMADSDLLDLMTGKMNPQTVSATRADRQISKTALCLTEK